MNVLILFSRHKLIFQFRVFVSGGENRAEGGGTRQWTARRGEHPAEEGGGRIQRFGHGNGIGVRQRGLGRERDVGVTQTQS